MSVYVMSDIHGEYEKYRAMLEKINLQPNDTLYILGDIIDRGKNPVKIFKHIAETQNIKLLVGNHEQLFLNYYETKDRRLWFANGGKTTYKELRYKGLFSNCGGEKTLYDYLIKQPYMIILNKNLEEVAVSPSYKSAVYSKYAQPVTLEQDVDNLNEGFILTHAGLLDYSDNQSINDLFKQDISELLWIPEHLVSNNSFKGFKLICGHTTVQSLTGDTSVDRIQQRGSTVFIDCGAPFKWCGGRLACLRLGDMQEFYIS